MAHTFCGMIEGEKDNELSKPKGTNDILPGTSEKWQFVEETARLIFKDYQYQEIRTPIFEHYEVISRSVGDTTDIVSKEMYDFYDKGDRHVTLRPEGQRQLFGPSLKINYMVRNIRNHIKPITWGRCSAMNAHKLVVCVNSIKLVWKHLVVKTQHWMLKSWLWLWTSSNN